MIKNKDKKLIYYYYKNVSIKKQTKVDEWIYDNYYLLDIAIKDLKTIKKDENFIKIQKIIEEKIFNNINPTYEDFINKIKDTNINNYEEIYCILPVMKYIIINKIIDIIKEKNTEYKYLKIAKKICDNYSVVKLDKIINNIDKNNEKDRIYLAICHYCSSISSDLKLKELESKIKSKDYNYFRELQQKNYDKIIENNQKISNYFILLQKINYCKNNYLTNLLSDTEKYLTENNLDYDSKKIIIDSIIKDKEDVTEKEKLEKIYNNFNKIYSSKLYIFLIIFSTILLNSFVSFFAPKYYKIILFLIMLIPFYVLSKNIVDIIYNLFVKKRQLMSLDLKEIPEEYSTLLIVPTLLNSPNKIWKICKKLQDFNNITKQKNVYYALVGDATEENKLNTDLDKEIMDELKNNFDIINKNESKFYYTYRKRTYSNTQKCYVGKNKKFGAIQEINKLILNKYSNDEISEIFNIETLSKLDKKIKYIIVLDEDCNINSTSIIKMVSTMMCQKNDENYGILTPQIASQNNGNLLSRLFTQNYNNSGELYFNAFNQGTFCGKGIYNVEVYDNKVNIPDDMILSHDIVESTQIKTGLVNATIYEETPQNFFAYKKRKERWLRGDVQNLWLYNPKNALDKLKIIDNVFVSLIDIFQLILLILSTSNKNLFAYGMILFTFFAFKNTILGLFSPKIFLKDIINIIYLPYNAYLELKTFILATYRSITKKKLLDWIPSSNLVANNSAYHNITMFIPNCIVVMYLLLNILMLDKSMDIVINLLLAGIFILSLTVTNKIESNKEIKKDDSLMFLAKDTWKFFEDNLTKENNYLIADNYQENRNYKLDTKTSSTNIGFSLLSTVSAYELNIIDKQKAVEIITNIVNTIKKMDKKDGNLYNWYSLKNTRPLSNFVSSVDSGNLVASYIVTKNFLSSNGEFGQVYKDIVNLCNDTDLSIFYASNGLFSVGCNGDNLVDSYYQDIMSESRILSYIAISRNEVPTEHWFNLRRYGKNGKIKSWAGSTFEYFMPNIFMSTFKGGMFDKSYKNCIKEQEKYCKKIKGQFWGISESAKDYLDNCTNYKYESFSVPKLRVQYNSGGNVLSPYSSILCLTYSHKKVIKNYKKILKMNNMVGMYGLYESYDLDTKNTIKCYYSHHQGMILCSLANYYKNNILNKYFNSDYEIKQNEYLLKEGVE